MIAGVLAFLLLLGGGAYFFHANDAAHQAELEKNRAELEAMRTRAATVQAEAADLGAKLAAEQARIGQLEKEKASALDARKSLADEMRTALESKDVTISQLQGKLTVNILDRVLFDSGEAELKPGGAEVIKKVASILADHPALKVHVIGHTDDVPIRAGARKKFPSNWELSTARATAAVRFLTEQAGVDPHRLGAVGYGEFRPIADNTTPEGRAKNRRIAITILSEELAGSDAVPGAGTNTAPASVAVPFPAVTNAAEPVTPGPTNDPAQTPK